MFDFAFKSAKEALYMEGHGIYVWSVVIVVSFCLIYAFIPVSYTHLRAHET